MYFILSFPAWFRGWHTLSVQQMKNTRQSVAIVTGSAQSTQVVLVVKNPPANAG